MVPAEYAGKAEEYAARLKKNGSAGRFSGGTVMDPVLCSFSSR